MADDYWTCPNDVYEDERLVGAPLSVITGHAAVMLLADDHGLFDGNIATIARRWGSTREEAEALFDALEDRKLVSFYEAKGRGGVMRRVGKVVEYHAYKGHPNRVRFPTKRGASCYPLEDGASVPSRRARSKRDTDTTASEAAEVERGSDVAAAWNDRGSGVEETRHDRGSNVAHAGVHAGVHARVHAGTRAQHSTAQHSGAEGAPPRRAPEPTPPASTDARAIGGPVPVAPSPSALGGAAVGAPMGDPPSPRPEGPMTRRLREEAEQKRAAERKEAEVRALALAALEASRRAPDKPLDDPEALRRAAAEKLADGRLALPPPVQSDEPDEDDWDHVQALVAARSFVVVGEEAPCLPD